MPRPALREIGAIMLDLVHIVAGQQVIRTLAAVQAHDGRPSLDWRLRETVYDRVDASRVAVMGRADHVVPGPQEDVRPQLERRDTGRSGKCSVERGEGQECG